jgi:hypothetical protein
MVWLRIASMLRIASIWSISRMLTVPSMRTRTTIRVLNRRWRISTRRWMPIAWIRRLRSLISIEEAKEEENLQESMGKAGHNETGTMQQRLDYEPTFQAQVPTTIEVEVGIAVLEVHKTACMKLDLLKTKH